MGFDNRKGAKKTKSAVLPISTTKSIFDRLEYFIIRLLMLALLIIAVYQILDSKLHIVRLWLSRFIGS